MTKLILLLLLIPSVSYGQTKNKIFESNLPIFIIETENRDSIVDDPKITAHLGIIYNVNGGLNYSDDPFNEYDGHIGIEIRGNSTAYFDSKKPYSFETRDNLGQDLNVSLFGLPSESDWILRSSYFDHTFIRNPLANYMSRQTGYWASKTKHVEVVLNGEYQGIYLFMEKIKRDKNRVNINKLKIKETSGEDLTGGYIWEITGFRNYKDVLANFGENRKIKYPKYDKIHPIQLEYIQKNDNAFRTKMDSSPNIYANPNSGYVEHIWVESFIYEVIIQESMRNSDAYGFSGYYHKDKNGLINAGPVWDFDQSSGNSSYPDNGVVEGWMIKHPDTNNTPFYWSKLFDDPYFKYSLSLRWKELRADKFKTEKLLKYVDSISSNLSLAQNREFKKWPVLGQYIWRETQGYEERNTYQKEVDYLKVFLRKRWDWMDLQLTNIPKPNGYPQILIQNDKIGKRFDLLDQTVELDLNILFSFPFDSKLKFETSLTDNNILSIDLKKNGKLEIELKKLGFSNVLIMAKDTYGNKKTITLDVEVVENSLIIFPNPSSQKINILFKNENNNQIDVRLYSIKGELIDVIFQGSNKMHIIYDCDKVSNGIYLLKIKTDKKIYSRKVIINN